MLLLTQLIPYVILNHYGTGTGTQALDNIDLFFELFRIQYRYSERLENTDLMIVFFFV
jgi:hypothetical protein